MSDFVLPIALGIALAAATGFRVFLPMLIVSAAAYTGHLPLDNSFAWLGTRSALVMLSVAAIAEILAYYIPVVDNLLDALATPATKRFINSPANRAGIISRESHQPACFHTARVTCGRRLGKNFLTSLQHWSGAVTCPACLCDRCGRWP